MNPTFKRWMAVGTASTIALFGLGPASAASAAGSPSAATNAATYLAGHLPNSKAGFDKTYQATLGLASTGDCDYSSALGTLQTQLESLTPGYVGSDGVKAAKAAIAAMSIGDDPADFAGMDLISVITDAVTSDGQVGTGSNGFSQALAIIALARAEADLPASTMTKLLSYQQADGGFAWSPSVDPDPDTTAVAILALKAAGGQSAAIDEAVSWAAGAQAVDGSWAAEFSGTELSPVDSTGLLGSALASVGQDSAAALSWLEGQQLASGAFSNVRDGSAADLMATAEAMYLLTGNTLLTATLDLGACPSPLPDSTSSCDGVWVVVYREAGDATVRCATVHATGFEALASAGMQMGTEDGFLNRINGYPAVIDTTWSKFWNYWYAEPNSDGTWGDWVSYQVGGADSAPRSGSAEAWVYSAWGETPTVNPPAGYSKTVKPTISGKRKVGKKLTAIRGAWLPSPDKYSYRWFRNGNSIKGATSKTHKLKKADKGKRITVKVTVRGDGLQTVSILSAGTRKIRRR